eukprot:gene44994-56006_t
MFTFLQAADIARHTDLLTRAKLMTVNAEYTAQKVSEYKTLDSVLLSEINTLISKKRVTDEDSILRFDIERAKKLLREWLAYLAPESILYRSVLELMTMIDYGYNLLLSEKLIPMTVFGKAF